MEYDLKAVDSWDSDTIIRYNFDLMQTLRAVNCPHMFDIIENCKVSMISLFQKATVDFGPMYVAMVAHRQRLVDFEEIEECDIMALKSLGLVGNTDSYGGEVAPYYYVWSLHS